MILFGFTSPVRDLRPLPRRWVWRSLAVLTVVSVAAPLRGDTFYFLDGRVVNGRVLSQSRTEMVVRIDGKTIRIQKLELRSVRFNKLYDNVVQPKKAAPMRPGKTEVVQPDPKTARPSRDSARTFEAPMLVPGWGQWRQNRLIVGGGLAILFTASAVAWGSSHNAWSTAKQSYGEASLVYALFSTRAILASGSALPAGQELLFFLQSQSIETARRDVERRGTRARLLSGATAFIWMLSCADAFLHSARPPGAFLAPHEDGLLVGWSLRF